MERPIAMGRISSRAQNILHPVVILWNIKNETIKEEFFNHGDRYWWGTTIMEQRYVYDLLRRNIICTPT
jgi:hypothetical protein